MDKTIRFALVLALSAPVLALAGCERDDAPSLRDESEETEERAERRRGELNDMRREARETGQDVEAELDQAGERIEHAVDDDDHE